MTGFATKEKSADRKKLKSTLKLLLISLIFVICIKFSEAIRFSIIDGIRLSVFTIVPTLFPFLILSEYISANTSIFSTKKLRAAVERAFGLPPCTIGALICGNICGFPIGAKVSSILYKSKLITKGECERLIGISNNPSLAFTISGVGIALRGSMKDGVLLYFSMLVSSIIVGVLFNKKTDFSHKNEENVGQSFSLASSIKNSAISCINISGFVVFFCAVTCAIREITKSGTVLLACSLFLEVSNASRLLSTVPTVPDTISLMLTAFALAFSGISVHMQVRSLLPDDISMRTYYKMKLLQGVFAAVITLLISCLI